MPTAEEHMHTIVGGTVAQLMVQLALTRAELDAARERVRGLESERAVRDRAPSVGS
jgi:hypothetical protein